MTGLRLLGVFVAAFCLIALGIRSYVRIARRARDAGKLHPGASDSPENAVSIYRYAFTRDGRSADSWFMVLGFGGAMALLVAQVVIR